MDSDKKNNYSSGTFQTITIWLLIPENMAIDTKIMFITVLETKEWSKWHIIKMFSDTVEKNMCVNIHDRRSIGVARSEARDMHTHLQGNKGITIQTVSVYASYWLHKMGSHYLKQNCRTKWYILSTLW